LASALHSFSGRLRGRLGVALRGVGAFGGPLARRPQFVGTFIAVSRSGRLFGGLGPRVTSRVRAGVAAAVASASAAVARLASLGSVASLVMSSASAGRAARVGTGRPGLAATPSGARARARPAFAAVSLLVSPSAALVAAALFPSFVSAVRAGTPVSALVGPIFG